MRDYEGIHYPKSMPKKIKVPLKMHVTVGSSGLRLPYSSSCLDRKSRGTCRNIHKSLLIILNKASRMAWEKNTIESILGKMAGLKIYSRRISKVVL